MSAFLPPTPPDPPSRAPPSSSIHHSTAHFTVSFCLLPPSVSFAPLPCSFASPSSHPLPVQPPDMNSFHPLTVFPSSFLLFPSRHSSSGPLSVSLPHQLSPSSSFVRQWSGSTLADIAVCVNSVLSFTAPLPPIAPHPSPASSSPHPPPPSLFSSCLPPTYIRLQVGEFTFQPWAAGLNDCLWGQLWLHKPAANIWATHTLTLPIHMLHRELYWTLAVDSMNNIRFQSLNVCHFMVCVIIILSLLPAA